MIFWRARQILAITVFAVIGAVIPYMADSEHLIKNGAGATLPVYLVAYDLYVFTLGLLSHRILKSNRGKAILLIFMGARAPPHSQFETHSFNFLNHFLSKKNNNSFI
jgi:hypothetical protein